MDTRRLGRCGHRSSLAILGGAAFWDATPDEAGAGLAAALDAGVNHLDVAPQYGRAEEVLGPHIPAVRDRLFVGCKTLRHDPGGVRAQLEESLRKLGCEQFDLYQMHSVGDLEELGRRAGAADAMLRARDEGLCRFVGITGHDHTAPGTHLQALQRYDLDTVMFPVNARLWSDPAYRADTEALLALCAERDLGVMAIKAAAARPWGERAHTASTWYEPYVDDASLEASVRFTLSVPGVHAFCTPGDRQLLPRVLAMAASFTAMDEAARADLAAARASESSIFPMPRG